MISVHPLNSRMRALILDLVVSVVNLVVNLELILSQFAYAF